jgi:hypothetical protein
MPKHDFSNDIIVTADKSSTASRNADPTPDVTSDWSAARADELPGLVLLPTSRSHSGDWYAVAGLVGAVAAAVRNQAVA